MMEVACRAHLEKKAFLEKLLSQGERGPLALLTMNQDGQSYLRMHRVSYLLGMVGLNELVKIHTGQELHETPEAFRFGLKVIAHMKLLADKFSHHHNMNFKLEQTPAESTSYRFAKLDLKYYSPHAGRAVRGDLARGEVYYTNSTQLHVASPTNPIERVRMEGLFHPLIEAGAITHLWLGEQRPSAASLANFVEKIFRNTQNDQVAFSPEFTTCLSCARTSRGLSETCGYCGSDEVEGITRITGYFTKVSSWNKGKIGELHERDRNRGCFAAAEVAEVSKVSGQ
jgi:ribonucleoside-triphosphate reductase